MSKAAPSELWFRRALGWVSMGSKKPKFQPINWSDEGEVRPVTRGKAKQYMALEVTSPTTPIRHIAPYRMESNVSYSSQVGLIGDGSSLVQRKGTQDRTWLTVPFAKK